MMMFTFYFRKSCQAELVEALIEDENINHPSTSSG